MATRTLVQLSKAVMEKLALIDSHGSVAAVDHQTIVDRYTEIMEQLRDESIGYWDDGAVPLLVFGAVTDLVALHVAPSFGAPLVPITKIEEAEVSIKRRIKRHTKKYASGDEAEMVDF